METDKNERTSQHEQETLGDKNTKSSRKKKTATGKKSRKKKSKQDSPSTQVEAGPKDSEPSVSKSIREAEEPERLEKTSKGDGNKSKSESNYDESEIVDNQHSMPRSRSGSRSRFSSLFRRKKKFNSETDLRKERGGDSKDGNCEEETKESENPRRKGKRHTSAEDLKRRQQKSDSSSSLPLKSNLKRVSPYREFSPKTQPRDRLQHMTLREVAKEQKSRRSESLPRTRRDYVSFDDQDRPSPPESSSNLSNSATNSGDHSPASPNSHTLPRASRNASSLTPQQHSFNRSSSCLPSLTSNNDTGEANSSSGANTSGRLQRPPDSAMETSQDSGVVVLGGQPPRQPHKKQEKSSEEKLLELKQHFPHAFSNVSNIGGSDLEKEINKNEERKCLTEHVSTSNKIERPGNVAITEDSKIKKDLNTENSLPQPETAGQTSLSPPSLKAPFFNNNKEDKETSKLNETITKHVPQNTPSTVTNQNATTTTGSRQQSNHNTNTLAAPSFLVPYRDSGGSSGASSRVTSMASSHRSSDLGYVDGTDSVEDDEEDDDNSAFSTPPEELFSETHKHKSYIHPEMLEKYLSSVLQNNTGQNMPFPEIDVYDVEQGNKVYPNSTLPAPSRKISEPSYQPYETRKARRNLKRSVSDVIDRRNKPQPKNFSGSVLGGDHPDQPTTPAGSVDTLSDLTPGSSLQAPENDVSKIMADVDGDRASLTSTVTLTHPDGKSPSILAPPDTSSSCQEKQETKAVPVMGTTAQSIYHRNFSPLRTKKLNLLNTDTTLKEPTPNEIQSQTPKEQTIPKTQIPEEIIHSASFQPISSPREEFPVGLIMENAALDSEGLIAHPEASIPSNIDKVTPPSNLEPTDNKLMPDIHDNESLTSTEHTINFPSDPVTPRYLITGLEIQPKALKTTKIKSLADCLNNQSIIAKKNEQKTKLVEDNKVKGKKKSKKSFRTERGLKESTDIQQNEKVEEETTKLDKPKSVQHEDKECQTPSWLLDDIITLKTEYSKKPKGILGRRKKQSVGLQSMAPLQCSSANKESLEPPTKNISPSTASIEEVYLTPQSVSNDNNVILRVDAPISPESLSPASSKHTESSDIPKTSDNADIDSKNTDDSGPSKEVIAKPAPKSKPLSLSAVILLKNRIAKYREKKKEKKGSVNKKVEEEEEKVEPESPSDTFMTIENEINLSKLEVSRETDILDADYFEPEFSLDYSKKQIRFEDISPSEPVQSEEPLPPLPATTTRRLRQRRESTMREKRRKCLSYCKRFVAFLFSHIGLCSLVVAYTILGGFIFQALESHAETAVKTDIKSKRTQILGKIISMAVELEKSEESVDNLTSLVNSTLLEWQADIHHATKDQGWDGTEKMGHEGVWSFASSLLYAITVTTTIGYGHVAPKTPEGRLVTIGYAVVGIPLTLLCLTNIGDVMATGFRLLYGKVCCGVCCTLFKPRRRRMQPDLEKGLGRTMVTSEKEESDKPKEVIHVPTSLCLLLIAAYIFAGAMLFSMWENWDILTGSYFCFITLSTIGFGDIVPGMETNAWSGEEKLVLCALYLVFGLSLIAMCFNLVQEDVKTKCRWLGEKLGIVDKPQRPM